ncbi:TolC family protein [Nubsella zeaxanthinifaciens]|uniref:TolC family protein n=1 Tax=Nubsella zeaxanthinifaciens TaxID=392412 RepID=UPI003D0538CC
MKGFFMLAKMHGEGFKLASMLCLLFISPMITRAQLDSVSLEQCYVWARENYPDIAKLELMDRAEGYELSNLGKRFLPQLAISGQASYQSQTVDFQYAVGRLPGISLPSVAKDQYRIQGEVSQLIYDGGDLGQQKALARANVALQKQRTEISLYAVRQRLNSIYFSILLMDEQAKRNVLHAENIKVQIRKMEASVKNGTALRSSLDELRAELLHIQQQDVEYQTSRQAYMHILSLFIGKQLSEGTKFSRPRTPADDRGIDRPELRAFELQRSVYKIQRRQLEVAYLPQISAFFQAAYGRPTLNIIENRFGPWYITGLRVSWSLGSLYLLSNKRKLFDLNEATVETDSRTFLLNTKLELAQQDAQVAKYVKLIAEDEKLIGLRTSIRTAAEAQLENGVITTSEYVQKVNAENLAWQSRIFHQLQLLQARYHQKFISGN